MADDSSGSARWLKTHFGRVLCLIGALATSQATAQEPVPVPAPASQSQVEATPGDSTPVDSTPLPEVAPAQSSAVYVSPYAGNLWERPVLLGDHCERWPRA